jgi:hypothetical protein
MATDQKVRVDVLAAVGLAAVLVILGELAGDASLGLLITIIDFFLVVYAMCRSPIRHSMLTLTFLAFALPNRGEGQPTSLDPPFATFGAILLDHLNTVDRSLSALSFSGMDVLFVILGLIILYRRSSGSKIDLIGRIPTPKPMLQLAGVSLASAAFVWVSGIARGGDFGMSLWQLYCVIYLPIVFLLFQVGFRGPKDHWNLARVLLAAVVYKCLLAVYIMNAVTLPMDPETGSTRPPYATAHADSMLFAAGFVMLIAPLLERAGRRTKWYAAGLLPILIAGTIANNRRLAWVQVGLVFLTVYLVSRESPTKRKFRRVMLALTPVIAVYAVMGWNSAFGAFFKPIRLVRSVVDAKTDASSMWREYENVNIIATFRTNPLFGTGYGHPYQEIVALPAVDYSLEKYTPHNSLLGLWCYCGYVGYAGITMLWVGGVYFAMRSYYKGTNPEHRAAALVSFGSVLIYMMQSWGDLGLSTWTGVFLMSAALTVAGKLVIATGQWGTAPKPPTQGQEPQRAGAL